MASRKSPPKAKQSQAQRFLDAARKAQADKSAPNFARNMGKITLAKQGRKPTKMG